MSYKLGQLVNWDNKYRYRFALLTTARSFRGNYSEYVGDNIVGEVKLDNGNWREII